MLKSEISSLLEKPTWVLFISAALFYWAGLFLFSNFVWSTDFYEINYESNSGFENHIGMVRQIDLVRYLLSPLYIIIISIAITGLIKIGLLTSNIEIENKMLFKIILLSSFFLSLPFWIKSIWFVLIQGNYNMDEVKFFSPLSVLNFFDPSELHGQITKALGRINIFHMAFILFVAWVLKQFTDRSFLNLFGIVAYTYGIGFLLLQTIIILIFI